MVEARTSAAYQVEPDFAARQSILWAIAWLVGGATVSLALQVLLFLPDLGAEVPLLTLHYGRLRGVADTAVVFGWLGTVGFAVIFAILPRITEVQLHNEVLGAATTLTWSLVLTGGIVALVLGLNQGRLLGELPAGADLGLVLMLVFVLYNAGVTVVRRREQTVYVSGWYLLAAALLAPIVFVVGNLSVFSGVTDVIVSGFYLNGIEMLWLLPIGLGVAHYVVPVETGNPLYSNALARAGFWSLVFAGGWSGHRFFMKGPGPDYLEAITVSMTFVLLIPVVSSATNLFATGRERWHLVAQAFGLRFAATGMGLLVAWIVLLVVGTVPSISRFFGLTAWQAGVRHLAVFGVFTSLAFAFVYHAYPLMVGRDWFSPSLSSFHFWATHIGVLTGTALLLATGAVQASLAAAGAEPGPLDPVPILRLLTGISFLAVTAAQYAFAYNIFRTARSGPIVAVWAPDTASVGGAR